MDDGRAFARVNSGFRADSAASTSSANAASPNASSTQTQSSATASAAPTANALVARCAADAGTDTAPAANEIKATEIKFVPAAALAARRSHAAAATNSCSTTLAPIHALLAPPAALIKLKTPPRTHSFFDARNTLGFATLGASLTADALSTQKGLAYPGFAEMNPIARPFVQSRTGAAVYNAGSFGLMAGLMYWAHKKEHHKLERILPFAIGSWEGLLSARNYHVIANRPR